MDVKYRGIWKEMVPSGHVNTGYAIQDNLLRWKSRIYVPEGLLHKIRKSEHDSNLAGLFDLEQRMKFIIRNLNCTNM
jgi:hypothetical protein